MSWDVHLEADLGNGRVKVGDLEANYTYNVSGMFREAVGSSPSDWNGRTGAEVAPICEQIIRELESNIPKYDAMNPPNGWGHRDTAIEFIRSIMTACRAAPKAFVVVS